MFKKNISIALLIVWFTLLRKSDQPEDGSQPEPKHVVEKKLRKSAS